MSKNELKQLHYRLQLVIGITQESELIHLPNPEKPITITFYNDIQNNLFILQDTIFKSH